jgi:hypothetical protein
MTRPPRIISPATKRRWRLYEVLIALAIAGFVMWLSLGSLPPDDPRPVYIDVAYPVEGYQCPEGYDGPEAIADNVLRCTLKPEAPAK